MDVQDIVYKFLGDFVDLEKATQKVMELLDKYSAKFKQTDAASTFKKSKKSFEDLKKSLSSLGSAFRDNSKQSRGFFASISVLAGGFKILGRSIKSVLAISLGKWLTNGINESIKFVENLNLFKVAMGESVEEGLKFVDTMAELYGMDPSNLYRYAGYFYELTDAIGMADEASATLSLSMTKAANDIASLFNIDIETVVNNLASGMQGMSRSVRKYGMDIRAVTLQQTALSYGITEQVENMSEANRMALRYLTMMEQVRNATSQVVDESVAASGVIGDFARNIETPANQLRIFKEQMSQLGRAVGNFFIPMLQKLLPVLNGLAMAIRTVLNYLAALLGLDFSFGGTTTGAEKQAEAFGGIGEAAKGASKAAKELKKTLAPFDEINLLSAPKEDTGGGGGGGGGSDETLDPRLLEAMQAVSLKLDEVSMKAKQVRDRLLKFFGFDYVKVFNPDTGEFEEKLQWFSELFKANLIDKFPQWSQTITALFENWTKIIDGFKNVFSSIGEVIDTVKTKVKEFIDSLNLDSKFAEIIGELPDRLNGLSNWISEHKDQIANFVPILTSVLTAFKGFKMVQSYLAPLISIGAKIAPVIVQLGTFIAPIAALITYFALLYTNSESFATSLQNLFQTFVNSLAPIAESVETLVTRIWESIQTLWEENLQPMFAAIGDAGAPILDVLSTLWETFSSIVQSVMDMLGTLWETVVSPIIASIASIITNLMGILQKLWEQILKPILDKIFKSLPELFDNTIKPIIENIGAIISGLIEILTALWTETVVPLLSWLINTLGPSIRNVVSTVWDVVSRIITNLSKIINGLLTVIRGVIDFLVGVFTGDWQRAWNGIKEIFSGVANAIAGTFEAVVNAIISVVNSLISVVWSSIQAAVNGILSTINYLASIVGFTINLQWGSPPPAIGYLSIPKVALASGGVVTGPTNALIGEGKYDEAVIPLGNSPQMNEFADKIAGKINTTEQISLLREQNSLLRQILDKAGDSVGIRDLSEAVTRVQSQKLRMGG